MHKPGTPKDLDQIRQESTEFPLKFSTLLMATVDDQGHPTASYAPFVNHNERFYVFISELAKHTHNLLSTKKCSALFIENEEEAAHLFARRRLTLQCEAIEYGDNSDTFKTIMPIFKKKFGKFMSVIEELKDFHLIELTPLHGSYVSGFARAYSLNGQDLNQINHRNEVGHQGRIKQAELETLE